jgi:hypothetical protein
MQIYVFYAHKTGINTLLVFTGIEYVVFCIYAKLLNKLVLLIEMTGTEGQNAINDIQ